MRTSILIFLLAIAFSSVVKSQSKSDWTSYLAYKEATGIAESNSRVYVLANGSLYSYGKEDQEITLYSRQNGLHDTDINLIRYCADTRTLLIAYSNGNIDLYDEDGFTNIPFLKNASNIQDKNINDVFFHQNRAYLSCAFGVVVINLVKKEILETYRFEKSILSACLQEDKIYVSTDKELLAASTQDNLLDPQNWKSVKTGNPLVDTAKIGRIRMFGNQLCMLIPNQGVYARGNDGSVKQVLRQPYIKDLSVQSNSLLVISSDNILYVMKSIEGGSDLVRTGATLHDVASLKDDGRYWIALGDNGLVGLQKGSDNKYAVAVSNIAINSPKRNNAAFMTVHNGKLLVTGGGRGNDRYRIPGTLMVMEDGKWFNFDERGINQKIQEKISTSSSDYMNVALDPDDENHYFVATYGEGVIEFKDNEFVEIYNFRNSTLKAATLMAGHKNYVRIGSVCFDAGKNLWLTNTLTPNVINVRKADGNWSSLYYPPISEADKVGKILITRNGHKWVNVPERGIFVFDDHGTIDDTSDDAYNFFASFKDLQSRAGGTLSAGWYETMVEDKSGTIWIGTNNGLFRCSNPEAAIDDPENLACSRLIRDGDAYFLNGESVNAIAVDAANQKWIGTASSGVFLITEDGTETVYHFTMENSPLLSDNVVSIAVDDASGEVFFGTDRGIVSFRNKVSGGGGGKADIYAYPNPVRPEYMGNVTIVGLSSGSSVKITDISGNLIYQGKAVGGQFTWNCLNSRGNRVATGVYLVLSANNEGSEGVVAKIAVVR